MKPSRIAKRLLLPALLVGGLLLAQAVLATPPTANFTFTVDDPNPPNACQTVTFTDASIDAENDIQSWVWDFGDGATLPGSLGGSVTHIFSGPGARTVTLTATDADDPDPLDVIDTDDVTIPVPASPAPVASVPSASASFVQPGQPVTFTGSATDDGSIKRYEWDFDGGATFEPDAATGSPVIHQFTQSGSPTVQFRAIDNCDQPSAPTTTTVVVADNRPEVSFTFIPTIALRSQMVTLTAAALDVGGNVTLYEWDVDGDGDFDVGGPTGAALDKIETSFATSGYHRVRLRVTDNSTPAQTALYSDDVYVDYPPEPNFEVSPTPPLVGDSVRFDPADTLDRDGQVTRYEWDLDGDGAYERSVTTADPQTETYASGGTRTVRLRTTDDQGAQDVISKPVTVGSNMRPEASFRVTPAKRYVGDELTFSSTSDDPDDRLTKQEWDFNSDGRYDAEGRVVSRKLKKGKHRVTLRATDSRGASADATQVIEVKAKPLRNPLDLNSTVSYIPRAWGMSLVGFTVRVQANTSVSVACKGPGCPRGTFHQRTKKNGGVLTFRGMKGNLRVGAKISIVFTRPGHITGWNTITIRGDERRPRRFEGCKLTRAKTAKRCPSG